MSKPAAASRRSPIRTLTSLSVAVALAAVAGGVAGSVRPAAADSQLEELFSPYVQIVHPQGEFCDRLIKLLPPEGSGWRSVETGSFRMLVPAVGPGNLDTSVSGSRLLREVLGDSARRPRAVLRVDSFTPAPGDPEVVDADYAQQYAEQYPQKAFEGKFDVFERGQVILGKKHNFAMVGGTYHQGAAELHRLQLTYLAHDTQLFVTFDCPESEWPAYEDRIAQVLLSLDLSRSKAK